jgi:hypothetical protein
MASIDHKLIWTSIRPYIKSSKMTRSPETLVQQGFRPYRMVEAAFHDFSKRQMRGKINDSEGRVLDMNAGPLRGSKGVKNNSENFPRRTRIRYPKLSKRSTFPVMAHSHRNDQASIAMIEPTTPTSSFRLFDNDAHADTASNDAIVFFTSIARRIQNPLATCRLFHRTIESHDRWSPTCKRPHLAAVYV